MSYMSPYILLPEESFLIESFIFMIFFTVSLKSVSMTIAHITGKKNPSQCGLGLLLKVPSMSPALGLIQHHVCTHVRQENS